MLGKQIQDFITPCTKKEKNVKRVTMKSRFKNGETKRKNRAAIIVLSENLKCNVNKPFFFEQTGVIPPSQ